MLQCFLFNRYAKIKIMLMMKPYTCVLGHYCKMQLLTESIIHVIIVNRKRIIAIMFMQAYCHFPNYVYTHCYFYVLLYLVKKRTTSSASKEKFFLWILDPRLCMQHTLVDTPWETFKDLIDHVSPSE